MARLMGVTSKNSIASTSERLRFLGRALSVAVAACLGMPAASQAKEPIEVGTVAALSGYLANYDGEFLNGLKLAVKVLNENGGADGHMINLHILDNGSNATTGVTVTNQLINQYNVTVMLNGASSAVKDERPAAGSPGYAFCGSM